LQRRCDELAGRLGLRHGPRAWLVPAAVSPLLWALAGRPRVLLPAALWSRLPEPQRDALLLHELAHLKRGDHWVRRLELVVLGLYWWLPTAWWARAQLQRAEEECCDAWVVWAAPRAAEEYALALVETVQFLSGGPAALPAASAAGGPGLKRRVTMILTQKPARPGSWRTAAVVVLAAGLVLPWGAAASRPAPAQPPAGPDPPAAELPAVEQPDPAPAAGGDQPAPEVPAQVRSARAAALIDREIAAVRDEIELLQVQVRIREAHLEVARAALAPAEARLRRVQQMAQANQISAEELEAARGESAMVRAQLQVREAELREPMVKLRQAERRLAELEKEKGRRSVPQPSAAARGLEETIRMLELQEADLKEKLGPDHPDLVSLRRRIQMARDMLAKQGGTAAPGEGTTGRPAAVSFRRLATQMEDRRHIVRFTLTNTGGQPLRLAHVRTTAAFLTVQVQDKSLAPGQQTEVVFFIDRTRFTGRKTVAAFFLFDPPLPEGEVTVDVETTGRDAQTDADRVKVLEKQIADLQQQLEELRKRRPDGPRP
jgi:hypothetical protein